MQNTLNKILLAMFVISILCGESAAFAAASQDHTKAANHAELGKIPAVSNHYQAKPVLYDFENMPAEHFGENIQRRFVMGSQSMMTRWEIKAGVKLALHFHPNEQITRVEKGELHVISQGDEYYVKPGQVMVFPANVPHEFVGVKDTNFVEYHTPVRQDFVNGEFEKAFAKR